MILVRHAESEWNRHFSLTRVDPNIPDPPLTELGRQQAEELIDRLADEGIRRLIASPYRRTLETASIIAGSLGLAIAIEPLVRERCVFSCDLGTPASALARLWPDLDFAHVEEQWWGEPTESEADLELRCTAFRAKVSSLDDRPEVAVISHWGFIRALTGEELANADFLRLP